MSPRAVDPVTRAAEALGVTGLVDPDLVEGDPRRRLQLTAAVLGTMEAYAMVDASALAQSVALDPAAGDPVETVDHIAYRAAGMSGSQPRGSDAMWSIWTLRRVQTHLATMLAEAADPDLAAACALLDGAHALLSGFVYRVDGDTNSHDACVVQAQQELDGAVEMLRDVTPRDNG
jgi:hypothetical protein